MISKSLDVNLSWVMVLKSVDEMMKTFSNRNSGLYNSDNTCPSFAGLDTQWSISHPYSAQSALNVKL